MYSVNGYRRYSRDVDNAFNIIPSDRISMKGVDFPVIGVDEFGIIQFMQPEKEYQFPGNTVFEVPIMERGGWLPSWDKVKATLNPYNWGVKDYSDKGSKDAAFATARKAGEKEFMWNNKRFNTKSDMSPEQQLKVYGITDERFQNQNIIKNKIHNNLQPRGYNDPFKRIFKALTTSSNRDVVAYPHRSNRDVIDYPHREDAWSLYMGKPQIDNTFSISRYEPPIRSEDNLIYYSINKMFNRDFEKDLLERYGKEPHRLHSDYNDIMGNYIFDVDEDEHGKYISYEDRWDLNPFGLKNPINNKEITTDIGKPFKIYNRIYYRDNPDKDKFKEYDDKIDELWDLSKKTKDPIKGKKYFDEAMSLYDIRNSYYTKQSKYIRQYYSDKELLELDINKKNFDTLALQRELSNRGYKLPKSTKQDGTFDGIWGDETKNALLDWQNKNSRTSQQKYQQGGTVGMDGMMKARLALDSHFGNPTARRMTNYDTRNYKFDDGSVGNVYVSSYDNLVTPHIQLDENNNLIYVDDVWSDNNKERSYQQSMKFEREEDAEYFGKNYKRVAPMKKLYQDGGYAQEEDPTTQLLYSIAEALQQGSDPREILNALKQNGVPEEQAMELIKYVMEQMQQQDQLQKEEKQQLEYAQDGKIVRKYNVEDLDWGKGINRAMLAFNMLQTPGLWQAPVKHGVLDALNAGLGLAAGLSGVGLGYSKLGAKKEYLGAKGLEPMKKLTTSEIAQTPEITAKNMTYRLTDSGTKGLEPIVSSLYIPEGKDVTKVVKPSSKISTWDWQTQHPDLTAANMTGTNQLVSSPYIPEGKDVTKVVKPSSKIPTWDWQTQHPNLTDNLNQLYNEHFGKQLSDFINANSENINTLRSLYPDEDLSTKQDGGYAQEEDPTTQLLYSIAEALQQGSDPREILNALKQNGVPEEQAMELIKYVMEQMQQQDQLQKEEKQQLEYAQEGGLKKYQWNENYGSYKQYLDNFAQQDFSQFSKEEQTKPEDNVKNEETKQTFYTGDPYGMLMANNALVGFQKFNDYLSDKDYEKEYNRRMMQIGNTNAKYNPVNYDNPYGTYTPNVGIGSNYGLVANGPIQDFGTGMFMAEEGGRLPQMQRGGIVTDKTVDPDREKTVDVSNKKSNKISDNISFLRNIAETVRNLDEPLIGRTYYFNGKPYLYNPEAREGRKFGFIASNPDNDIKQIDVDIFDFNKALNKDQIINNYYGKHYTLNELYNESHNPDDISKVKLERYYVSDNKENAKSYEDPDFYTFTGKDSEYKVPYKKLSHKSDLRHVNTKDEELYYLKNNMNRVIQKDDKLYYLYSSFLNDIPYVKKISRQSKVPEFFSYFYPAGDLRENYEAGFKSVPTVYAIPLDSNYEPIYDEVKIFDENDLRNARLAHNPFAKKEEEIVEEEIVEEEPTNTNKTTTTTQSSSKNNTSGKSTTQKENSVTYNPKEAKMFF